MAHRIALPDPSKPISEKNNPHQEDTTISEIHLDESQLPESHQSAHRNASDICVAPSNCYALQPSLWRHIAITIVSTPYYSGYTSTQNTSSLVVALQVVVLSIQTFLRPRSETKQDSSTIEGLKINSNEARKKYWGKLQQCLPHSTAVTLTGDHS